MRHAGQKERTRYAEILDAAPRFWSHVDKRGAGGCWLWVGPTLEAGYGTMYVTGVYLRAPRVSWILAHGCQIPADKWILHRCDVRACVNPEHLFVGDHADNTRDMVAKGRSKLCGVMDLLRRPRGERSGMSKLTNRRVRRLLDEWRHMAGTFKRAERLAIKYGITRGHVYKIARGERWAPEATT